LSMSATRPAAPADIVVLTPARLATESAYGLSESKALPQLKPYQPNHRMKVPSI
jgi:hypothetical protein